MAAKTPVNDLIFKELIKRGYALEGNTRIWNIADSKLWYLTPEQAKSYLDLDHDATYIKDTGQPQGEKLIENFVEELIRDLGDEPFNIVDLGCGDGEKAAHIVKLIKKLRPSAKMRYCPIDISGFMVSNAIKTFSDLEVEEIIEFQYNISDFDNLINVMPLLKEGDYKKNLILLLGNTLGNFEINELLYDVKVGMDSEDIFILDLIADDEKQDKRANSYGGNQKFNDWLIHVPLQLGLEEGDVKIGGRWRKPRIEVYYEILKDKSIKFHDKKVCFKKGDQIIVVVGYKYNKDDLQSFLRMHFDNVTVKVSEDKTKIVAICKR